MGEHITIGDFDVFDPSLVSIKETLDLNYIFDYSNHTHVEKQSKDINKWHPYVAYTTKNCGHDPSSVAVVKNLCKAVEREVTAQGARNNEGDVYIKTIRDCVKSKFDHPNCTFSRHLQQIAQEKPEKGAAGPYLVEWYKKTYQISSEDAEARAVRELFTSYFYWQFIQEVEHKIHDTCGSVMCLALLFDYPDAQDDAKIGKKDAYVKACCDGVQSLRKNNQNHVKLLSDLVKSCAYMVQKDKLSKNVQSFGETVQDISHLTSISPETFMALRWWDAVMAITYRIEWGFTDAKLKHCNDFTPNCVQKCMQIRRAVDSGIRYDEMADVISDVKAKEVFNEVLFAFSRGGIEAVVGYAESLSTVCEDVIDCQCQEDGHIWGAAVAQSNTIWYVLHPRYQMLRQLHLASRWIFENKTLHANSGSRDKFPVASVTKESGEFLLGTRNLCRVDQSILSWHTKKWKPTWKFQGSYPIEKYQVIGTCTDCLRASCCLTSRILCQPQGSQNHHNLGSLVYKVLTENIYHSQKTSSQCSCFIYDPISFSEVYKQLCCVLYNYNCQENAREDEVSEATNIVGSIVETFCHSAWNLDNEDYITDKVFKIAVNLFTEFDQVIRKTYYYDPGLQLQQDGIWRRQLLIALLSTFIDYSPIPPYAILSEYAFFGHKYTDSQAKIV